MSGAFVLVAELQVCSLKLFDRILDGIRALPEVAEIQSHIRLASAGR